MGYFDLVTTDRQQHLWFVWLFDLDQSNRRVGRHCVDRQGSHRFADKFVCAGYIRVRRHGYGFRDRLATVYEDTDVMDTRRKIPKFNGCSPVQFFAIENHLSRLGVGDDLEIAESWL